MHRRLRNQALGMFHAHCRQILKNGLSGHALKDAVHVIKIAVKLLL